MNLVILGSNRKDSNTLKAAEELCPVDDYEIIDLLDYEIGHFSYEKSYSPNDGFMEIAEKMKGADHIVFATPVYWYAMSGPMKVFFDRFTNLMSSYSPIGRMLAGKKTYLIASGTEPELPDGFEVPFAKTSEYFDMEFMGTQYKQFD